MKLSEDESEIEARKKEAFRNLLKMERTKKRSGCLGSLVRLFVFAALIGGIGYGIYLWQPWGTESVEKEVELPGCDGTGYEISNTFKIVGIPIRETTSTMCFEGD